MDALSIQTRVLPPRLLGTAQAGRGRQCVCSDGELALEPTPEGQPSRQTRRTHAASRPLAAWEQQSRRGRGWEDGVAWASLAATREVSPVPCTAGRREGRNQGEPRLSPPWVGLQSDVRPLGGVRLRPGTAEGSASAEAGGGEAHVAAHREDTGAVGSVSVEARRAGERRCIRLIYDTRMQAGPSGGRGGSTRVSFQSPGGCAKP